MLPNITQPIVYTLLIAVGLMLLWLVLLSLRQRIIARLGLRNIPRRPGQTALIVLGLTLSTIIIVSSLALGDTLTYSIRQQAVDAYGQIDEVLSPPLLGTLTELGISLGDNPQETTDETEDAAATGQADLLAGGLTSVLALLSDGLPGISQERYDMLEKDLADEPLVDGVAPSILFPIIIRNRDTGQGEPLGFLFAIDDAYEAQFDLRTTQGDVADMETLRPGVGNVFELAADLFATTNQTIPELTAEFGFEPVDVSAIVLGAAAVGVALANVTADNTATNNSPEASEEATNNIDLLAQQIGVDSGTIQNLLDNLGLSAADLDLQSASSQLFDVINLNTLGDDIDRALAQLGLELRHGEVYLNRVGAETLNARPGDLLDVYIGPVPLPYRVADIVEQAGPAAALFPTVVMPLAEAQRLLFMEERINSVLISNQGDALEGLALTDQVNKQLRSLSLNDQAVDEVMAILRADDVRSQVERQINREMSRGFFDGDPDDDRDGPPALVQDFIQENFGVGGMDDNLRQLQAALDGTDNTTPELRKALGDRQVQFWLNDEGLVGLSAQRQAQLSQSVSQLNELDVLEPLSKQTVVNAAAVGGTAFTGVFSLFGFFSILAGIILIVMIFVMLAAERRSELGIARAVGMQRGQLVQMFVTEGLIYDLFAAAIGVALGLAVSYAMVGFIGGLFNDVAGMADDQLNGANLFRFRFTVIPSTIIIGYCLGVLFTFAVVTFASYRVSRLNIIAAIRDLPESSFSRKTSRWGQLFGLIGSLLLIMAGLYVVLSGTGDVMTTLTDLITGQMALTELALELTRTLLGATLFIAGFAFLLGQILRWCAIRDETRQRVVYSIIGIALLILWVTPWYRVWSLFFGESQALFQQDPALVIISFVISGPLIILGAILTIMYNANSLIWIINGLLRVLPHTISSQLASVLRTAIAYPLNARFRTGMAMLLFSMIIATVVIMSVVIQATQTVIEPNSENSAGFEIQVDPTLLSLFNPTASLAEEMNRLPDFPTERIQAVGQVARQQVDITELQVAGADGDTAATRTNLTGINDGYLQQAEQYYTFQMRAPGYETDAAIWEALRNRDDVAIVNQGMVALNAEDLVDRQEFDDYLRRRGGGRRGPGAGWRTRLRWLPGFTLEDETMPEIELGLLASQEDDGNILTGLLNGNPATEPITVQVIGVLSDQSRLIDGSVQVNERLLTRLMGVPVTPERFYVKAMPGEDVRAVAQAVEGAFVSGGLNATVIAEAFAAGQAVTRGVLRLFQGFLALGLLVGMAALGVISSRAVVERRQQVGMLRAIGYQSNMVAFSFVLEASFIAFCGLGIGTLTGIALGQNVVGELFSAISGETIPIPWRQIGGILASAYAISLLTTILPALQAARIYPAEALRYD